MGEHEPDKGDLDLPGKARIARWRRKLRICRTRRSISCCRAIARYAATSRWRPNAFANEDWEAVAVAHQLLEEVNGYDGTARAGRLLHGLGFPAEVHEKAVSDFSGGWRVRLNVARALMTPSDLLLLDEPTNHWIWMRWSGWKNGSSAMTAPYW